MNPQQDIYNTVFNITSELLKTYEINPDEGVAYPFAIVDETQFVSNRNKSVILGNVFITVHFYAEWNQKGTMSEKMHELESVMWNLGESTRYKFYLVNTNSRMLKDDTTNKKLHHGVLELELKLK